MMNSLKKFGKLIGIETGTSETNPNPLETPRSVAIFLYEAARVDNDVTPEDLKIATDALARIVNVTQAKAIDLLQHASRPENRPTSYQPLAKIINEQFSYEKKRQLINAMWLVAHSDAHIDPHEDHIIRKISDLLYVSHRDFIQEKISARETRNLPH